MGDVDDEEVWPHVPDPLDDPAGFLTGWIQRFRGLWTLLGILLFVAGGAYTLWAYWAYRRVSADLFLYAFLLVLLLAAGLREWHRRVGRHG